MNPPTPGTVGLAVASASTAAAGNSVSAVMEPDVTVTSLLAPRLTSKPSTAVPGARSHVALSQTIRNAPTAGQVGLAKLSVKAAAAGNSVSTVTVPVIVTSLLAPRLTSAPSAVLPGARSQFVPSNRNGKFPTIWTSLAGAGRLSPPSEAPQM